MENRQPIKVAKIMESQFASSPQGNLKVSRTFIPFYSLFRPITLGDEPPSWVTSFST